LEYVWIMNFSFSDCFGVFGILQVYFPLVVGCFWFGWERVFMHIQEEGKNGEIFNFFNVYSRTHKYTQILILKWNRSDGPSKLNEAFIQYKYNWINNIFLDKNFRIKFFWGSIN